jgi:hypothetical protein
MVWLKAGRRSGSLPFPETLRAFAVRYVLGLLQRFTGVGEALSISLIASLGSAVAHGRFQLW